MEIGRLIRSLMLISAEILRLVVLLCVSSSAILRTLIMGTEKRAASVLEHIAEMSITKITAIINVVI